MLFCFPGISASRNRAVGRVVSFLVLKLPIVPTEQQPVVVHMDPFYVGKVKKAVAYVHFPSLSLFVLICFFAPEVAE